MQGPDPLDAHPKPGYPRVCFLKPVVTQPNIEIGDYTYYDDPVEPERFAEKCVLYHFDFIGDRLVIGRFCALAEGVAFLMNGANHALSGFSTFPFPIFGSGWDEGFDMSVFGSGFRGDTIVGHDVWIGRGATIMPGVGIGDGAIVAAASVVVSDVPPYAVVGGNPARVIRQRFDDATGAALREIAWWNWPADKITRNRNAIAGTDLEALRRAA